MSERSSRNRPEVDRPNSAAALRLGVVSDTHGHVGYTLEAVRMLESLEVDVVLHCGDIGSPAIVPLFTRWPTHFVFGNVDFPEAPLTAAIQCAGLMDHGRFAELELAGQRIAVLHGDDNAKLAAAIAGQQFDLVCHGHTHQVRQERQGRTHVLNPGALYRANPHTLAIVELPAMTVTFVTVA